MVGGEGLWDSFGRKPLMTWGPGRTRCGAVLSETYSGRSERGSGGTGQRWGGHWGPEQRRGDGLPGRGGGEGRVNTGGVPEPDSNE